MIGDVTMGVLEYALDGVALRGDVRANNIANMNTPGFQAQGVDFESALAEALGSGDVEGLRAPEIVAKPGLSDAQGNNVTLENEMIEGIKDNLAYETFINSFNYKISMTRTAINAGGS